MSRYCDVDTTTGMVDVVAPVKGLTRLRINEQRLLDDFNALSEIGRTADNGVNRLALSNEDLAARAWFANTIDEAGLHVRDDEAGNLSAMLLSADRDARTLLIGSHLDSVPNGGFYDGSVGVLAGLECLRTVRDAGLELPVHLEAVSFTDEEGCWYSLFGSKAMTGKLNSSSLFNGDGDAGAFRAALFRAGINHQEIGRAARDPESLAGYIELHIEQGSRLYNERLAVGVVSGIVGRTAMRLTLYGEAGHSGTTAWDARRDALRGAAQFINQAHDFVRTFDETAIFNCGDIHVTPGKFNIIPDSARLDIEIRHPNQEALSDLEARMIRLTQECAAEHRLTVNVRRLIHMPAAPMSPGVMAHIDKACRSLNIKKRRQLISYAGHDAQMFSSITPTGMIFIPSVNGISHNPREHTEWNDVVRGANVLLQTVLNIALNR